MLNARFRLELAKAWFRLRPRNSGAKCHRLLRRHLCMVDETGGDSELEDVRARIIGDDPVNQQSLGAMIRSLSSDCAVTHLATGRTLDLIAHSEGVQNCLSLAGWKLDAVEAKAFFSLLRSEIDALKVSAIRILGCGTATTTESWAALLAIRDAVNSQPDGTVGNGIDVLGTKSVIVGPYFNHKGFRSDYKSLLVSVNEVGPSPIGERVELGRIGSPGVPLKLNSSPYVATRKQLHALPWEPMIEMRRLLTPSEGAQLVGLVESDAGRSLPGLLALPMAELAVPAPGPPGWFYRFQVLYQSRLVRAFPFGSPHGVVYLARSAAIAQQLSNLVRDSAPLPA